MRRAAIALGLVSLAAALGCGGQGARAPVSAGAGAGDLHVAVEGACPKLGAYGVGTDVVIAYGTYGLEDVLLTKDRPESRAAQALALVRGDRIVIDPALMAGLPLGPGGYARGDLEVGGRRPRDAWLVRVDTEMAPAQKGALFERRRAYYGRFGPRWTEDPKAVDRARPGARPPPLAEADVCEGKEGTHFARHATERIDSGDTVVAGRCEDDLGRAEGGVTVATFHAGDAGWRVSEAPPSPLWDGIVNLDLVFARSGEAYLYAYAPYDDRRTETYLASWDGSSWRRVDVPFPGPITSLAVGSDGALWAVARFSRVFRRAPQGAPGGGWGPIALARPAFVDPAPAPESLRVLEVQTTGADAWVHAAYPIAVPAREDGSGRGHVLMTTRAWGEPWRCDRAMPASRALSRGGPRFVGADLPR